MQIDQQWAENRWPLLVADAGLALDRVQLIVVRGERPEGAAEAAYVPPSFDRPLNDPKVYSIVRRIGDRAYKLHHVIAIWESMPDRDEAAVEALLRHELEHAKQWEQWGRAVLDELDAVLKDVVGNDAAYHETPVERAADDAARSWIARDRKAEADRLTANVFPHWAEVQDGAAAADLRAETIAMLRDRAPVGYLVEMPGGKPPMPLDDFIQEHAGEHNPLLASEREEAPSIEFVD